MTKNKRISREGSSFRDPSGFVYYKGNKILRQINKSYKKDYDYLLKSGLYKELSSRGYLLPHKKTKNNPPFSKDAYLTLKTQKIPFISYPYEWSFGQLKDAALLTLKIQVIALKFGMILKDASAYNVQFLDGKPIFIDLLSFEIYKEGSPWVAYKQFCQHFLAPLLLISKIDHRLKKLLRIYLDGIPLDLVSKLLPKQTYLSFPIATHIHYHARNQKKLGDVHDKKVKQQKLNKLSLLGIIDSLKNIIDKMNYLEEETEWGQYYSFTNYTKKAFKQKAKIIENYIKYVKPKTAWDLGANSGEFSRIISNSGIFTLAADIDPVAVEKNYQLMKNSKEENILPLIIDITNPSPSIGWMNEERQSLINRGPANLVMALAMIHHLAISNNLPFEEISDFFCKIGDYLIIEFVPKEDSQVKKLLSTRDDIFDLYTQENFEDTFSKKFKIIKRNPIKGSVRTCYLMKTIKS